MQNKNNFMMTRLVFVVSIFLISILTAIFVSVLIPQNVSAAQSEPDRADCSLQNAGDTATDSKCNGDPDCVKDQTAANCGITRYLIMFVNILTGMVGVAVVGSIIVGGIQYSMSAGDAQAVGAAKKRISNALLALFIYAFTFAFLQWIVPGGVF